MLFSWTIFGVATLLIALYVTYLRLKFGVSGIETFSGLPQRQIISLSLMLTILCWLAFVTSVRISRVQSCLKKFRLSRKLPRISDEDEV